MKISLKASKSAERKHRKFIVGFFWCNLWWQNNIFREKKNTIINVWWWRWWNRKSFVSFMKSSTWSKQHGSIRERKSSFLKILNIAASLNFQLCCADKIFLGQQCGFYLLEFVFNRFRRQLSSIKTLSTSAELASLLFLRFCT